ncbi:unnamed protein product [Phaedon cochleariae]|uniref:RZZ complex subunit KNTC1/ROD C-terminal domain-containing protein n=1 Tax=Phaedon cochleariae TaxID=80249 RepID=A0A9N9X230_PHACE|nr:unnamed protein product [Phaedon cochleariae]
MEDFGVIEIGFNSADETMNFGSRCIGYENLYEISTIACFTSDASSTSQVTVNCLVQQNGHIVLATGNSLKIFDDTQLTNLVHCVVFNTNIVDLAVSPNNRFLLLCLDNGIVNIFDESGKETTCVYTKCLTSKILENDFVKGFHEEFVPYVSSFVVVYHSGTIFRLFAEFNDEETSDKTAEEVVWNSEEICDLKRRVTSASYNYPVLLTNGGDLNIINVEDGIILDGASLAMKQVYPFENKFISLDFEGKLWMICSLTLIYFSIDYDTLLEEILVLDDENTQILAATKPNELGESFLQLLNEDFSNVFSLRISHPVNLVQMLSSTEDLIFVSKVFKEGKITELRLQSVYETQPELKLAKLIKRHRFEEAEQFAKTFNINPVIILKAKAQLIVDKAECSSEDINNLIKLMDSINDEYFNLECCSNVDCSNFEDVKKILIYGSGISPKNRNMTDNQMVLTDSLFRFDTYRALSDEDDIQAWYRFHTCDLIEELKMYLRNHKIEDAIMIYSRLDKKTIDILNEDTIEDILAILNNFQYYVYQPFLPTFIPITMAHLPRALPIFIKWLHQKIFVLEKRDKLNFPQSGIYLAENMLKLLKVDKNSIPFQRECTLIGKSLDDLSYLMDGLIMIQNLKKQFGINIQLSDYFEGPKSLMHTLLNIIMSPDDYDHFLKEFLYHYMLQNRFDPDSIFLEEIKNQMKYEDCWETITSILKHISSVKMKLTATIEILDNAPVPWCDVVRKIGQSALKYSHPLVSQISYILQDEQRLIVMRNPNYKIRGWVIKDRLELIQAIRRLIYVNESSLVKDALHLCKTAEDKRDANVVLIENFILKGCLDDAMSILENNSDEDIYACSKTLLRMAEIRINSKLGTEIERGYFYNVLGILRTRLLAKSENKFETESFDRTIQVTRAVYNINKHYKLDITTDKMRSVKTKNQILEELIEDTATEIKIGHLDIVEILNHAEKLSLYFSSGKDQILNRLCEKIGRYDIVLKVAEHLNDAESDSKCLYQIAILFLKYLGSNKTVSLEESFDDSTCDLMSQTIANATIRHFDYNNDSEMLMRGIKLARNIVTKALCIADKEDIEVIVEIMNWLDSCFYLTRQSSSLQRELFRNLYNPKAIVPSFDMLFSIRSCFQNYLGYIENLKGSSRLPISGFANNIPLLTQEQLTKEITMLPRMVENFCREGQHLTAFMVLNTFQRSLNLVPQIDSKVLELLHTIILSKCLPQLLHVVISANYIDVNLLYNILLACRKDYLNYIQRYMKLYKRQPRKLYDLSVVGVRLLDVYGETSGRNVMVNAAKTCKWWKKLKSVHGSYPYDDFFKCNADARLKQLISLDAVDVDIINMYTADFELEAQHYYMEYLSCCLLNWLPEYRTEVSLDGKKSIIMENDELLLLSKCQKIIELLVDKVAVFNMLENISKTVNFYYHEVFICIYKILVKDTNSSNSYSNNIVLLLFLKKYCRFSPPNQREKEEWYTSFPDSQTLDPLSEFRLPFTKILFTSDIWSILRPEISLKSYELWFGGTDILMKNLKIDDICVYAVKQVVSSGVLGDIMSKSWVLYPKFEDLFQEVDKCVQHISDLERATSVIYHLMYHTPNGADKVIAAKLSYKYAAKYIEKYPSSPDVAKAYMKVKNKYFGFSAMHILYKYNLATEKYLGLVSHPESLVENLYMDERIVKGIESVSLEYSDVSKAVDALSEIFGLNIMQIRSNLLNHWLNSSDIIDLDSTVSMPTVSVQSNECESDDNLKRATYMCSTSDIEYWQTYLLKIGLFEDDVKETEQKSLSFKAKALKCFCAITDEEKISQMTKLTYTEFWDLVNKLTLLSELEILGISLDLETLDQYNKKELLKRLSQLGTTFAIKGMGSICMTYALEDNRYWEYIIKNSIKLGMVPELKVYVDFLKNKCDKGFYLKAWQYIVEQAFQQTSFTSEDALQDTFVENFLVIQSCPVLFYLNFEKIFHRCIGLKKPEFAAVLLQYLPEEKKKLHLEEILKCDTVLENLDILEVKGIWGVQNVRKWINNKKNHI